jgi:hypothetical protein
MTLQTRVTTRRAAVGLMVLAAAGTFLLSGCDPRTLAYFLHGDQPEIPGAGPDLSGKKIVVVTTAAPTVQADSKAVDREINREVIKIFRDRVKKLEVVDPEKVTSWLEAHPAWTDPAEMVVHFEIQSFSIEDFRSPGLLEGNSEVNVRVTELAHPKNSKGKRNTSAPKESSQIFETDWKTTFPKNAPISLDQGVSRPVFRSKFLRLVATELSWQFVGHNNGDDIQDTKFGSR